ncbi:MAG: MBL fold metallo-hydrolase [Chloroflexi bacterium]|nr:MBL fold metallo-hydrolase [Chloroflexota bacterium]
MPPRYPVGNPPTQLSPHLFTLPGAVNCGVLVANGKCLLLDCCDNITPDRLRAFGIDTVEMILCTQHRRPNVAGAYPFVNAGAQLVVPLAERHLFENVESYWCDPANRWHIYHHQPGMQVLPRSLAVSSAVEQGETLNWRGFSIEVMETPGATDGSVSYLVRDGEALIAFTGDVLYGPGRLWDIYSLQKGRGTVRDYHGFMGNRRKLIQSLLKVGSCGADLLVPSHGSTIASPYAAAGLLVARLDAIWRNYAAISALNFYFPNLLRDTARDAWRMRAVRTHDLPGFVRRLPGTTSFAIVSRSGEALLIDCGSETVVETLQAWLLDGSIRAVEGCWITHYHDDHVDALPILHQVFGCPIMTDEHLGEIIEHPSRFFLPCISPSHVRLARVTHHRESWRWREFTLTAFHLPGQTLYHSGLLVEGHGIKAFLAGDSAAPTGLDDYCAGNRNFLGVGRGYQRCIDIWRHVEPDCILNQHQEYAFAFNNDVLDYMDLMLRERERLLANVLPWDHPNFGTDEHWVRTYPYQQQTQAGGSIWVEVQFTNHGDTAACASVEPVLPTGWTWNRSDSLTTIDVPALTDGQTESFCTAPDGAVRVCITIPPEATPGRHVVPFRVTWNDRYLGQFRHTLIDVVGAASRN